MTFAYQKHRESVEAKAKHPAELTKAQVDHAGELEKRQTFHATKVREFEEKLAESRQRQEDAERKLNEIPADALIRLQAIVQQHSFGILTESLTEYASYVERMKSLSLLNAKPIVVKMFVKRGEGLYAVAGIASAACTHLHDDDLFVLEFKDANGLVTPNGKLIVHQSESTRGVAWFRVATPLTDEIIRVEALAEQQAVPGKGYSVRPVCELVRYAALNLVGYGDIIGTMVEKISRERY